MKHYKVKAQHPLKERTSPAAFSARILDHLMLRNEKAEDVLVKP